MYLINDRLSLTKPKREKLVLVLYFRDWVKNFKLSFDVELRSNLLGVLGHSGRAIMESCLSSVVHHALSDLEVLALSDWILYVWSWRLSLLHLRFFLILLSSLRRMSNWWEHMGARFGFSKRGLSLLSTRCKTCARPLRFRTAIEGARLFIASMSNLIPSNHLRFELLNLISVCLLLWLFIG